jgi:tRNA(fMet)-specific endonuclease VapC
MSSYMLDTNIASHIIKGDKPEITRRLMALPMEEIVISAVTEGELLFGLAKRGHPQGLAERIHQFLIRVDVLPWDHDVTRAYADLRASCEAKGIVLGSLDMMIAGHAVAADCVLVSRDKTFRHIPPPLKVEDWTM